MNLTGGIPRARDIFWPQTFTIFNINFLFVVSRDIVCRCDTEEIIIKKWSIFVFKRYHEHAVHVVCYRIADVKIHGSNNAISHRTNATVRFHICEYHVGRKHKFLTLTRECCILQKILLHTLELKTGSILSFEC